MTPATLLICLESLRTLVEFDDTLCFHLADKYRRKFSSQQWLQQVAIIFCRQAKIQLLDKHVYTFENPATVQEALSIFHDWSNTNMGNHPLRRTVWQDRRAIFKHRTPPNVPDERQGKWLITQLKVQPNHLQWISYDNTDLLQARGIVVLCCPADLDSHTAMTRFVIREYGQEAIFRPRPAEGKTLHLHRSLNAPWENDLVLMFPRASNKHPLLHDTLHLCQTDLVNKRLKDIVKSLNFPFHDPERFVKIVPTWYYMLDEHFLDENIKIILHDSVFVSIA